MRTAGVVVVVVAVQGWVGDVTRRWCGGGGGVARVW